MSAEQQNTINNNIVSHMSGIEGPKKEPSSIGRVIGIE
jgi:hypothetical protein